MTMYTIYSITYNIQKTPSSNLNKLAKDCSYLSTLETIHAFS